MITQDERDEFTRDQRNCGGDFDRFIAWRQMRALEAIAEATKHGSNAQSVPIGSAEMEMVNFYPRSLKPGTLDR